MAKPERSGIRVIVRGRLWNSPALLGEHVVKFERGYCFLEETGKNIVWITPKKVFRADSVTLLVDTGFWKYGRLTLRFDSPSDADKTEQGLRKMLSPNETALRITIF